MTRAGSNRMRPCLIQIKSASGKRVIVGSNFRTFLRTTAANRGTSMRRERVFFHNGLIVIGTIVFLVIVTVLLANALA